MLTSYFLKLKRKLQNSFKVFSPSRSKYLLDIPATASKSERTRRLAALSLEVSLINIKNHKKEITDTSIDL
jgi:hypothetical protein